MRFRNKEYSDKFNNLYKKRAAEELKKGEEAAANIKDDRQRALYIESVKARIANGLYEEVTNELDNNK